MSYREKHLWISILATVSVWGFYYVRLAQSVAAGGLTEPRFPYAMGALFVGCLVVSVLVELALTLVANLTTRRAEREARDERELLAALKASHVSLMVLIFLVFSLAIAVWLLGFAGAAAGSERPRLPMTDANALVLLANVVMAAVIVSELVRHVFTVALLRRMR